MRQIDRQVDGQICVYVRIQYISRDMQINKDINIVFGLNHHTADRPPHRGSHVPLRISMLPSPKQICTRTTVFPLLFHLTLHGFTVPQLSILIACQRDSGWGQTVHESLQYLTVQRIGFSQIFEVGYIPVHAPTNFSPSCVACLQCEHVPAVQRRHEKNIAGTQ